MGATDELNELLTGVITAEAKADRAAGRARIGGLFFSPNYLRVYQRAAQVLVQYALNNDALDGFAVACVYQQRHALELALKALIGMFHEIIDLEQRLAEIDNEPFKRPLPSAGERERLHGGHGLDSLLRDLKLCWQREVDSGAQIRELPPHLDELVDDFCKLEDRQPSRFRYPVVRIKKDQEPTKSFPKRTTLPVREFQDRLDAVIIGMLGYPDELDHTYTSSSDTSLGHELANIIESVSQAIQHSQPQQPLKPFTDED